MCMVSLRYVIAALCASSQWTFSVVVLPFLVFPARWIMKQLCAYNRFIHINGSHLFPVKIKDNVRARWEYNAGQSTMKTRNYHQKSLRSQVIHFRFGSAKLANKIGKCGKKAREKEWIQQQRHQQHEPWHNAPWLGSERRKVTKQWNNCRIPKTDAITLTQFCVPFLRINNSLSRSAHTHTLALIDGRQLTVTFDRNDV